MIVIKNQQTSQDLTKKKHLCVMEVTVLLSECGGNLDLVIRLGCSVHVSVDICSVTISPLWPQPSRRAGRPSCTCGLREILLLFAVPSGSRWPYRASAIRSCSSALFAGLFVPSLGLTPMGSLQAAFKSAPGRFVHARSLGPSSLSVISLIALKVKRESQNPAFRF